MESEEERGLCELDTPIRPLLESAVFDQEMEIEEKWTETRSHMTYFPVGSQL